MSERVSKNTITVQCSIDDDTIKEIVYKRVVRECGNVLKEIMPEIITNKLKYKYDKEIHAAVIGAENKVIDELVNDRWLKIRIDEKDRENEKLREMLLGQINNLIDRNIALDARIEALEQELNRERSKANEKP